MNHRIPMIALAAMLVSACDPSPDAAQRAGATADARLATARPAIETSGAQAGNAVATAAAMAGSAGGTAGAMAGDAGAAAEAMIANRLIARVWEWQETAADGSTITRPTEPADYTLTFAPGGGVVVFADCKEAAGTYTADDAGVMTLKVKVTTTDACAEGSLADGFVEEIGRIATWSLDGTELTLGLADGAGTMRFAAR